MTGRWARVRRSGRRVYGPTALVLVLLISGACSTAQTARDDQPRYRHSSATSFEQQDVTCSTATRGREFCAVAEVSGNRYRFAVVPARQSQRHVALVDRGGPGETLFGPAWPADLLQTLAKERPSTTFVLVEEPWVNRRPTSACRDAGRTWFRSLRSGTIGQSAKQLVTECHLDSNSAPWGWVPGTFDATITEIESVLGDRVDAFYGASFAGTRLHYLNDRSWSEVALVSPLPPGVAAQRYLDSRQRSLDAAVNAACVMCRPSMSTYSVEGRSLPIEQIDRLLAEVSAGYYPQAEQRRLLRVIPRSTRPADLRKIGDLSDAAIGRIGVDDLTPARYSVLQEQCRSFSSVGRHQFTTNDASALSALFSPCAYVAQSNTQVTDLKAKNLCVATTAADSVVPQSLSKALTSTNPSSTRRLSFDGAHGALAGLRECLRGQR